MPRSPSVLIQSSSLFLQQKNDLSLSRRMTRYILEIAGGAFHRTKTESSGYVSLAERAASVGVGHVTHTSTCYCSCRKSIKCSLLSPSQISSNDNNPLIFCYGTSINLHTPSASSDDDKHPFFTHLPLHIFPPSAQTIFRQQHMMLQTCEHPHINIRKIQELEVSRGLTVGSEYVCRPFMII